MTAGMIGTWSAPFQLLDRHFRAKLSLTDRPDVVLLQDLEIMAHVHRMAPPTLALMAVLALSMGLLVQGKLH